MKGMIMPDYNTEELGRLESVIEGLCLLPDEVIRETGRAVETGQCPPHLAPFWTLVSADAGNCLDGPLFRKLETDWRVAEYSFYSFFPPVYARIYHQGERPQIWFDGRTRGRVALFRFANGEGLVVKPLQNRREAEIAQRAGEAGVGPRQFPSLDGFLVEELVQGRFFTDLSTAELQDDLLHRVGLRLGSMLLALHNAGTCYNDATVSDPEGRSHLLVRLPTAGQADPSPDCRLIDFGVSVLLDRFPDLEMEEVFNLVRTTPEYRLASRLGLGGSELGRFLAQYRQRLSSASRDEILARDLRIAEEGLREAAARMGAGIIGPFQEGFAEGNDR